MFLYSVTMAQRSDSDSEPSPDIDLQSLNRVWLKESQKREERQKQLSLSNDIPNVTTSNIVFIDKTSGLGVRFHISSHFCYALLAKFVMSPDSSSYQVIRNSKYGQRLYCSPEELFKLLSLVSTFVCFFIIFFYCVYVSL